MSSIQPQQQQVQLQQYGLTPLVEHQHQHQQHKEGHFNTTTTTLFNSTCNEVIISSQSQSSIPSPPCSIPDQQQQQLIYNQHQQMIGMPSPNITNGLFDVLSDQQQQQQHLGLSNEFHDEAAAVVAAAEQHMHQQQMIMMQQQQQQSMPYLYNQQQQGQGGGIEDGNTITHTNPISLHHEMIVDPKQFDDMSREQLIARLVTLEKEKHATHMEDKSVHSDDNTNDETEEEEVESLIIEQQQQEKIRTCLWADCGEKFDGLQKLISHITEVHVGGGKPTYRCEWLDCNRNNKPFTKRHKMYNHLRTHTGERPFACPKPDCDKKFSRPDSLTTHIKTHSSVRPFVCNYKGCGKAYYHSRSLKKHEKIHEVSMEAAAQPLPPSYEQVMATSNNSNSSSSRPTHIMTTNTTTTGSNNHTLGLVPTSIGHFVDPNVPFYGDQPQHQQQPPPPQTTFISTPVPYQYAPNFIMDPNMNPTPPHITTHFMGPTTSLIQDHQ